MGKVINTTSNNLDAYKKDMRIKLIKLVAKTATDLELKATRGAPRGEDEDVFIHIDKRFSEGGLKAEVGVMGDNNLAAYFEFGTGLSAKEILAPYPDWIKDIAREFYITGRGTLKGKPYLYNNYLMLMPIFRKDVEKLTKEQTIDK